MEALIHPATSDADIDACRALMNEYAAWLQEGICLQGFAEEMADLPNRYALILLARIDGEPAGCIAYRRFNANTAEAKRLWVQPQFHRHGVGDQLLTRVIEEIKAAGFESMVFDTLPKMQNALRLYQKHGFQRRDAYHSSPIPGVLYFEKNFRDRR